VNGIEAASSGGGSARRAKLVFSRGSVFFQKGVHHVVCILVATVDNGLEGAQAGGPVFSGISVVADSNLRVTESNVGVTDKAPIKHARQGVRLRVPQHGQMFLPDTRFVLWSAIPNPGVLQFTLYDVQTGKQLWQQTWADNPACYPMFTPDSRRIITALVSRGQVEVLERATGKTELTIHLPGLENLRPNGRRPNSGRCRDADGAATSLAPHEIYGLARAKAGYFANGDQCFRPGNRLGNGPAVYRGDGGALAHRGPQRTVKAL
jgi:hypothetical protein